MPYRKRPNPSTLAFTLAPTALNLSFTLAVPPRPGPRLNHAPTLALSLALALALTLALTLVLTLALALAPGLTLTRALALACARTLTRTLPLTLAYPEQDLRRRAHAHLRESNSQKNHISVTAQCSLQCGAQGHHAAVLQR